MDAHLDETIQSMPCYGMRRDSKRAIGKSIVILVPTCIIFIMQIELHAQNSSTILDSIVILNKGTQVFNFTREHACTSIIITKSTKV